MLQRVIELSSTVEMEEELKDFQWAYLWKRSNERASFYDGDTPGPGGKTRGSGCIVVKSTSSRSHALVRNEGKAEVRVKDQ